MTNKKPISNKPNKSNKSTLKRAVPKNKGKDKDINSDSDDDEFGKPKDVVDKVEYDEQVVNEDDDDKLADVGLEGDEDWDGEEDLETGEEEEEGDDDDISDDVVEIEAEADEDDDCVYNTGKKRGSKAMVIDRDDEDEDDKYDDDMNMIDGDLSENVYVTPEERRTSKFLLKYEMVRLKGDRTAQLTLGAKPMIKGVEGLSPVDIAQLELEAKMIPLKIIRPLPNGKKKNGH